jgi:serine/threonine protein kinase/tetratricopeptide (TPR) repeat protein
VDGQFEKEVAIKLLKRGTDTDEILRRFQAERRILARLDHPNIARLLDAGTTDDGLPYFIMEYVVGESLGAFVQRQLSLADRLQLFLKICAAVQFAHENLVVHRDLKTSNILVRADGEPKLLDFGIAKLLAYDEQAIDHTLTAHRRFTPGCASPEQVLGQPVTPASDVYALGALLYEMLTDEPPHRFSTTRPSPDEIARIVGQQEPAPPSRVARNKEFRRALRGDLDKIILLALRKEPARRYASVDQFAKDVRSYLEGRPVQARRNTLAYVSRRFVLRHKYRIAAIATAAVLVIALGALVFDFYRERELRAWYTNNTAQASIPEKSIAVLPFENLSDDNGHAYFADGVQEDIRADLARISELKVTSQASASHYREMKRNIREIGRVLQVAHVLEGTVQKTQGHLRVYARLSDTRSGRRLWAEQYDRASDDLFVIENQITRSIAEQMKAALSPQEEASRQKKPTKDMVAYDLYLQAKEIDRNSFNGMGETTREIVLLDEATRRDPEFVAALCLLSRAHLDLYWLNLDHTPTRLLLAKKALEAAADSQPDAGEVHLAKAILYYWGSRDYGAALAELAVARRQLPNELDVLVFTVAIEKRQGHWEEARRVCEQVIALDPLNPASFRDFARSIYVSMRLYPEAGKLLDAVLSWKPNDFAVQRERAKIDAASQADLSSLESVVSSESARTADPNLLAAARLELALWRRDYAAAERALADYRLEDFNAGGFITPRQWYEGIIARSREDKDAAQNAFTLARERVGATVHNRPEDAKALVMLAQIDAALGHKEEAIREGLQAIELLPVSRDAADGPTILATMASVYAELGETKAALDLLDSCAAIPNGPDFGSLKLHQKWDPLRGDPRFSELLEQSRRRIEPMSARTDVASNAPTKDLVAYDLFLRGQALMNDIATSTDWEGDNRRAIDLLERAVTHDPTFALAYAQLVAMHVNLYVWVEHSETRLEQAKAALQQAERLAPDGADTYLAAGELAYAVGDDSRAFERFGRAHRVRPNDEVILSRLAQAEENLGMWDEAIRDMEKARKIAPRNSNIPNYLKGMYAGRRDYGTSDRVCDEAIAQFPNGPIYYRAEKVSNSLDRGDPQQARVRLAEIPEKFNASGYRSLLSLRACLAERDYDRFKREFADLQWDSFIEDFKLNAELMRVLVAEQEGDRATIQSILVPRREKVARDTHDASHTDLGPIASRSSKLARIDSYLGRIEEALRESEDAVANTSDPVGRPTQEIIRAEVLMRAGQKNAALDLIEQLATVPYGPSYGDLLNPRWDRLRGDARFQRVVQQLAATAKN